MENTSLNLVLGFARRLRDMGETTLGNTWKRQFDISVKKKDFHRESTRWNIPIEGKENVKTWYRRKRGKKLAYTARTGETKKSCQKKNCLVVHWKTLFAVIKFLPTIYSNTGELHFQINCYPFSHTVVFSFCFSRADEIERHYFMFFF